MDGNLEFPSLANAEGGTRSDTPSRADGLPADSSAPPKPWRRRIDFVGCAVLLLLLVWGAPLAWRSLAGALDIPLPGEVLFTGLDDSAQSMLARSIARGAPLVFHDDAFAAVPPEVRPALLYRPGLPRRTRDLAHQLDPATLAARPFFQPFLPWQRAHLPFLPLALGFAVVLVLSFYAIAGTYWSRMTLFALLQMIAIVTAAIFLVPWVPRFAFGPFAEGPATLLAATALALAFVAGGSPAAGAAIGLCLGLAATFHPTLAVFAAPVALFAVLRRGAWRHTLALALGALAGLAPLVWSTLRVTAPYGNFLSPATLRAMIAASPDIRALAVALAAAVALGIVGLALAHAPRLRAAMARPRVRTAAAAACGAAVALAVAAALRHPAARLALSRDLDGIALALPPLAAAVWMTLRSRRPATCALVAGCALASLPLLVVQGQEVHVGIWSLRRSLPPFALLTLAAFFGALEPAPEESGGSAATSGLWRRRAQGRLRWTLLLFVCSVASGVRTSAAALGGREAGALSLARAVEARMRETPGALFLFDRFGQGAPFAALPGAEAFGLNDAIVKSLGHGGVAAWLRDECARRPVYVVACSHAAVPTLDDGIALVPEGEPVRGTVSRVDGKTFATAREVSRDLSFAFLRVRPAARGDTTAIAPADSPFGLAPGAWDEPRRGKPGRWACDGAAFFAPVPEPGGTVEVALDASWWTRAGTNAAPQRLRLEPPFAGEAAEVALEPSPDFRTVVLRATRAASDADPRPPSGLYRLRAAERYDERGFPPALAAQIRGLRASVR